MGFSRGSVGRQGLRRIDLSWWPTKVKFVSPPQFLWRIFRDRCYESWDGNSLRNFIRYCQGSSNLLVSLTLTDLIRENRVSWSRRCAALNVITNSWHLLKNFNGCLDIEILGLTFSFLRKVYVCIYLFRLKSLKIFIVFLA